MDTTPSPAPSGLVLRVATLGGFLPVEAAATALPTISVYADGRLIVAGPTLANAPAAAWPNLLQRFLTPAGIDHLVTLAVAAGVGSGVDLGTPRVFDAGTTVFTLWTVDGPHTSSALALGVSDDSLTRAQRSARAALSGPLTTLDGLADPTQTLDGQPAWRTAGTLWSVLFRPLLPDEASCADL